MKTQTIAAAAGLLVWYRNYSAVPLCPCNPIRKVRLTTMIGGPLCRVCCWGSGASHQPVKGEPRRIRGGRARWVHWQGWGSDCAVPASAAHCFPHALKAVCSKEIKVRNNGDEFVAIRGQI